MAASGNYGNEKVLAVIVRGASPYAKEEVRVLTAEFNGYPFVSIELRDIGSTGKPKRSVTVRPKELHLVIAALTQAAESLGAAKAPQHAAPPPHQRSYHEPESQHKLEHPPPVGMDTFDDIPF